MSCRFGARCPNGLRSVGDTITIFELARLVSILRTDPSTAIAAALEGWDYPISREALILMDQFDLDVQINSDPKKGRPTPHQGRPFKQDDRQVTRRGNAGGRTREEAIAILRRMRNGALT